MRDVGLAARVVWELVVLIEKILHPETTEDQRILIDYKVLVLVQLGRLLTQSSEAVLEGRVLGMGHQAFEIAMG